MYEEMKCTLVVITGENDIQEYTGVDITLSGGGRRHFFGALPERGDHCYVGWAARESSGTAGSKAPIIIGWVPSAPWMGHEWIPYQPMEPGEGMDSIRDRSVASGTLERARFKMRHVAPGNILMSSSQGSDISLNEGVLLTNRRANEINLRDEDQAIVFRSLQQFHAMAGVRTYSGMVQREARLLPSTMWGDGVYWDNPQQIGADGVPLSQSALANAPNNPFPNRFLTPGLIFRRGPSSLASDFETSLNVSHPDHFEPFTFLQWGAFVDSNGYRMDDDLPGGVSNTIYGGKVLYRVGLNDDGTVDNAISPAVGSTQHPPEAMTEYRVEITHTSNGTLPVTEQTDGFDADKLPTRTPTDGDELSGGEHQPFLEWVLGSVVGNDPFSFAGKPLYGCPLKPVITTESGDISPAMVSAIGDPIGDHAATLFRLTPPISGATEATFTSFTKDGRFKAYLAGNPISAEIATVGDLALSVGGQLSLNLHGGIHFNGSSGPGNVGLHLDSPTGAIVISGGGVMDSGSAARDAAPGAITGNNTPSVLIQGSQNVSVQSDGSISINAPEIGIANASQIDVNAQNQLSLRSGQTVSITTQDLTQIISSSERTNYGGPPGGNPASGPTRSVTFSGSPPTPGTVDKYTVIVGDRVEEFTLQGNHSTSMLVIGNLTYQTTQGTWKAQAGANSVSLDSIGGLTENVSVGSHSTTVVLGSSTHTAQTDIVLRAVLGRATIQGTAGVILSAPGTAAGDILCGSDVDPLTGIPYTAFLVPKLQKLAMG